jgi:hypothetical protein
MTMNTTDTLTEQPDTIHADPRTESTTIPDTSRNWQPQQPRIDVAPGRAGVAFAIAAAIGVGALVWAVIAGPTDTAQPTSSYDRVEQNRANTLRDLTAQPTSSYDRVEQNRANTLRDLTAQPTSSYDRVEQNRANTLRDLTAQPTSSYDRVEQNRANTLRDLTAQPT